jgi:hypothetical protein
VHAHEIAGEAVHHAFRFKRGRLGRLWLLLQLAQPFPPSFQLQPFLFLRPSSFSGPPDRLSPWPWRPPPPFSWPPLRLWLSPLLRAWPWLQPQPWLWLQPRLWLGVRFRLFLGLRFGFGRVLCFRPWAGPLLDLGLRLQLYHLFRRLWGEPLAFPPPSEELPFLWV